MDLHVCVPFAPVGLYFLFRNVTDGKIFLILYGTIAWYFAGVMVRLMLTLAPAACMLAAVGISGLINTFMGHLKAPSPVASTNAVSSSEKKPTGNRAAKKADKPAASKKKLAFVPFPAPLAVGVLVGVLALLGFYSMHATYVSSEAYSSPSIVLGMLAAACEPRLSHRL